MKSILCAVVFLTFSGFSQAWWFFNSDDPIHAQTGIDQSCVEAGQLGTCDIYNCLEQRFPCQGHSFAKHHGLNLCQRYNEHLSLFNDEGQAWVHKTQRCLTGFMLEEYRKPSTTCFDLNRAGWDRMSTCYVREGFCQISWENREALWTILQGRDLGHTIRVWREIAEIAVGCGEHGLGRFAGWARGKIVGMVGK